MASAARRVLAVASGGGHWVQLWRLRPAWSGCQVTYVTTEAGYRDEVAADAQDRGEPAPGYVVVVEANRWMKLRLVRQLLQLAWTVLRTRPHVVITTGAAPGFLAIRLAKLMGARTVWVDSIANAEE
jgi:UDP-N-acetylglucosamine:LPS N-acetylglucosamine transferase